MRCFSFFPADKAISAEYPGHDACGECYLREIKAMAMCQTFDTFQSDKLAFLLSVFDKEVWRFIACSFTVENVQSKHSLHSNVAGQKNSSML